MPSPDHHASRRTQLLDRLQSPLLLMAGGFVSRNYPDNVFGYRADSHFLFCFGFAEPGAAALLDPADRTVTLFLPARTPEDALWHGANEPFEALRDRLRVDDVAPVEELEKRLDKKLGGRLLRSIAVADHRATARANAITGADLDFYDADKIAHPDVIQAIGQLRAYKMPAEIDEMRHTAGVTRAGHLAAMRHTKAGVTEHDLAGRVTGAFHQEGCVCAYNNILSVRGEVLHNHHHDNTLRDGNLVLLDAGAENASGFCSDVTRTWPVSGTYSCEQAEIYEIVLRAEKESIAMANRGVRYRDLHLHSALVIAEGLTQMGIMRGNPSALVESGAHAVFFPHGVGHLIGLDVHDMEGFGDAIAYPDGRARSDQFGTAYLRLDMDCAPGMCFTIEPGIYFVPAILHNEALRKQFDGQIDFAAAERFLQANDGRGFGGVRIEDDILITDTGREVLTRAIPKERADIEAEVGAAFR